MADPLFFAVSLRSDLRRPYGGGKGKKMKNLTKAAAAMLALLLLCTAFASCGKGGNTDVTTLPAATGEPTATVSEDTEPEETVFTPSSVIKEENLDYTFKILSPVHDWAIVEMTGTAITGDVMKDAIYERQLNVEDRLGCRIEETVYGGDLAVRIRTVASAGGEDAFDLAQMPTSVAYTLFTEGYLADQADISTMNLDNPWWEKRFNDEVNLGNKKYITFGNESLILYSAFYIFCFNKDMITNYKLDDPYDLVKNNQWTWDKAYEMMKIVATDVGQDGLCDPASGDDIIGLTGHINHSRNLIFSSGITICQRDETGMLTYDGLTQEYVDAFTKFTNYFITDPRVAISGGNPNRYAGYTGTSGVKNYISVFIEGRSLFLTTGTNEVISIREGNIDYGIVVVPKYSVDQEQYNTPVYSAAAGIVIPKATLDVERSGKLAEALGAYSYKNIIDKHISIVLHYRVANDPTAIDMINLAYESGSIDVAMAHNFGQCTSLLNNLNTQGLTEVSRVFDQAKALMKKNLDEAREKLAG